MNLGTATITRSVGVTLPGCEPSEPGARFEAVLPWPPTVNTYWRHVIVRGKPTVLLSEGARAYRKAVVRVVRGMKPMTGPVLFDATFYPPNHLRRDLDNLPKGVFDSLVKAGILADDAQIREMRMRFGPVDRTGGRVEVRVMPLAEVDHSKEIA